MTDEQDQQLEEEKKRKSPPGLAGAGMVGGNMGWRRQGAV